MVVVGKPGGDAHEGDGHRDQQAEADEFHPKPTALHAPTAPQV
jgi:hypothetical protein